MMPDELPRLNLSDCCTPSQSQAPAARLVRGQPPGSGAAPPACDAATLIRGDTLEALRCLAEQQPGSVTLAYLDPPFFTGRTHHRVDRKRTSAGIERSASLAFDDRWDSLAHYLTVLRQRLVHVRTLLADHGSVVIHVDPKTSHYIKVMCDELFGWDCFASEVVWRYRRWPAKTRNFQRVHDVMLRYIKDAETAPRFNQLYEPLSPSTQKTWGDHKQRAVVGSAGRRLRSSTTEQLSAGAPLGDVWDIPIVAPVARERNGYPTQKPEALLRRWIEGCTSPGDLILDPYMGSGTTLKVAHELGRRAVGVDASEQVHLVTQKRLSEHGVAFDLLCVAAGVKSARRSWSESRGVQPEQAAHDDATSLAARVG
jgi:site-specific DNA-methyltransferase (adenine-specific)